AAVEPEASGVSSAAVGAAAVSVFVGRTYKYRTAKSASMPKAEPIATIAGEKDLRVTGGGAEANEGGASNRGAGGGGGGDGGIYWVATGGIGAGGAACIGCA
ncbi:MAG TPA: hypothetical protein VEX68_29915, partial [Bryobacteraceae bacterium]|nr:hypothetical protein [Bryobacteraceae bacterium]